MYFINYSWVIWVCCFLGNSPPSKKYDLAFRDKNTRVARGHSHKCEHCWEQGNEKPRVSSHGISNLSLTLHNLASSLHIPSLMLCLFSSFLVCETPEFPTTSKPANSNHGLHLLSIEVQNQHSSCVGQPIQAMIGSFGHNEKQPFPENQEWRIKETVCIATWPQVYNAPWIDADCCQCTWMSRTACMGDKATVAPKGNRNWAPEGCRNTSQKSGRHVLLFTAF